MYFYNLLSLNEKVNKNYFIKENDLIVGKPPDYFKYTDLYLFNLIYPDNLINHEVTFKYIHLVHYPIIILIFVCIGKLLLCIFSFTFKENDDTKKNKCFCLFMTFSTFYLITWIINLLFYVSRYKIHCIIDFYEEKVYRSGKIDGSITLLVFKILFSIIDFCLFVLIIIKELKKDRLI